MWVEETVLNVCALTYARTRAHTHTVCHTSQMLAVMNSNQIENLEIPGSNQGTKKLDGDDTLGSVFLKYPQLLRIHLLFPKTEAIFHQEYSGATLWTSIRTTPTMSHLSV